MLHLTIQHNIYLTQTQRYDLHEGRDLEVIGVSIPVWFVKNQTSEPNREVFCRYFLKNNKENRPVRILEVGYEIVLPNRSAQKPEISDEKWRELNLKGKLNEYYKNWISEASSKNLLDIKDGGSRCLRYREHNQIKSGNEMIKIAHIVGIEDISILEETLTSP